MGIHLVCEMCACCEAPTPSDGNRVANFAFSLSVGTRLTEISSSLSTHYLISVGSGLPGKYCSLS